MQMHDGLASSGAVVDADVVPFRLVLFVDQYLRALQ